MVHRTSTRICEILIIDELIKLISVIRDFVIQNASSLSIHHSFQVWWFHLIDTRAMYGTSTQISEILIIMLIRTETKEFL